MFHLGRTIAAVTIAALLGAASAQAQSTPPTFPTYAADGTLSIGYVSKLSPEGRARLSELLAEADTRGYLSEKVEARDPDPYGMVLYVLPSWESHTELPPQVLPPFAREQLAAINPSFFRYAIPARKPGGETFVLMFYVASQTTDEVLKCLSQDLMLIVEKGFASGETAACTRGP